MQKSFTWGGGQQCKVPTLLQSGSLLKIDCPVSHMPLAPPHPQAHPFQPRISTHVTQFQLSSLLHPIQYENIQSCLVFRINLFIRILDPAGLFITAESYR
jgi:hypothetical protein